jgi:uncharacterized protein
MPQRFGKKQTPSQSMMEPAARASEIRCVLIAPTGACNLRCRYCLADAQPAATNSSRGLLQLEKAQSVLHDVVANSRFPRITVIFQGGEPTLAPVDWYEALFSHVSEKASQSKKSLRWCLQTNGQQIDRRWVDLFKRHNVGVGMSIDGTPEIAAPQRSGTEAAADSVRFLRQNGIRPGVIVVGTAHNLPHITAIHEFFGELGVCSFHILPLMPLGRARASGGVPASVMTTAYVALINSFLRNPGLPREDRLHLLVQRFISNDGSHLTEVECQSGIKPCGKQLIFLDTSGGIFPCSYATEETLKLGDALSDRVCWSVSKAALETRVLEDEYSTRCLTCRATAICGFSCPAVNIADRLAREIACEFYQSLMEYFLAERPMIDRLYNMWNEEDKHYGNNSDS